jgi:hypothetical protein
MSVTTTTLADRMGVAVHESPLRFKIRRMMEPPRGGEALDPEDWLVELANRRGATVVFRQQESPVGIRWPDRDEFADEEIAVALCQLNGADRPQLLRLPAQWISRGKMDMDLLLRLAKMERAGRTLKELATQALKVEPEHPAWRRIADAFSGEKPFVEPLIHWTRLAEPLFASGKPNPIGWKLVA